MTIVDINVTDNKINPLAFLRSLLKCICTMGGYSGTLTAWLISNYVILKKIITRYSLRMFILITIRSDSQRTRFCVELLLPFKLKLERVMRQKLRKTRAQRTCLHYIYIYAFADAL